MASSIESARSTSPARAASSVRSPILNHFRLNPFRALRLPINVRPEEAVWKAEEIIHLERAGLPPAEPCLLPWLPKVEEFEIQQAIQTMEEPFQRLLQQVLYFDLIHDAQAAVLIDVLVDPSFERAANYLAIEAGAGPASAAVNGDEAAIVPADDGQLTRLALCVNQANLRLLLAARFLSQPELLDGVSAQAPKSRPKLSWKSQDDFRQIENVHERFADPAAESARVGRMQSIWTEAAAAWNGLLEDREFHGYLARMIVELDDELATVDDVETLLGTLRLELMDFFVGEVKLQVIHGRYGCVQALLASVAKSHADTREWKITLRSLRQLFETEIAQLDSLVKDQSMLRASDLKVYLDRLGVLAKQWKELDEDDLLGLGSLVDDRVHLTFDGLKERVDLATVEDLKPLFAQAAQTAVATSLQQRIQSYAVSILESPNWACFFCKIRDAVFDRSIVLQGKKETHREYYGNSTTIYYSVKREIVPRCERCTNIHAFLFSISTMAWVALFPAVAQIEYWLWFRLKEWEWFWCAAGAAGLYILGGLIARWIAAGFVTPRRERHYYNCAESKPYRELARDGYSEIKIDYGREAVKKIK